MTQLPEELAQLLAPTPPPAAAQTSEPDGLLLRADAVAALQHARNASLHVATLPANATSELAQREIADRMASEVKRARLHLYGKEEAPFPGDYAAGRADLLARIEELPKLPAPDAVTIAQLRVEADRLRSQLDALGLRLEVSVEAPRFRLIGSDGDVTSHGVKAPSDHPLRQLADTAEVLGRRERIAPARVLAHILTGEPLGVPRAVLAVRTPKGGGLTQLELRFLTPDATREDFISLQQLARDLLHGGEQRTRAGGLSESDARLLEVVRELGHDLERRAPKGFWAKAAQRVGELTHGEDTPSPEALRLRALKLRDRLQRLRATKDSHSTSEEVSNA